MPNEFWPENSLGWLALIAAPMAAFWGLLNFHRSNRNKAAEILMALEKDYTAHIPFCLQIEYLKDYNEMINPAVKIAVSLDVSGYTPEQSKAIDRLDSLFRYFLVADSIRRIGVDGGGINHLCAWYLRVLVTDTGEDGAFLRPELREYARIYWPQVYFWAPLASSPFFKRPWIYCLQLPERVNVWMTGGFAKPPQKYVQKTIDDPRIDLTENDSNKAMHPSRGSGVS